MMTHKKNDGVLGKKLFDDFNLAFSQLNEVSEVCIIYNEDDNRNKCPIHVQGNCIGVEKWCVMHLFTHAYNNFMKVKSSKDVDYLDNLTRCIVVFCPDCTTSWNIRKKLCVGRVGGDDVTVTSTIHLIKELELNKLSLRKLPKSTEGFAHRKWILKLLFDASDSVSYVQRNHKPLLCVQCGKRSVFKRLTSSFSALTDANNELLRRELLFCLEVAAWHPSNYSCWNHRVWLVNCLLLPRLLTPQPKTLTIEERNLQQNLLDHLTVDLNDVMNWMELHVSDHSCMSYIQFLLSNLTLLYFLQKEIMCKCSFPNSIVSCCNSIELVSYWCRALRQVEDLLRLHDGAHEAMWCHRRALLLLLQKNKNLIAFEMSGLHQLAIATTLAKEKKFCAEFLKERSSLNTSKLINNYLSYVMKYVF